MPNKNYQRGVRYERKIQQSINMSSVRTAGSHGVFDVIAYNDLVVRFIQSKATKDKSINIFSYKDDIADIQNEHVPYNTTKELWIYGNRTVHKVWVI